MSRNVAAALALLLAATPASASDARPRAELEAMAASGKADRASLRALGEFYAMGRDGKKNVKEAMRLWNAAADAGDPRAPILIADRLYREIWGPQQPEGHYVRIGRLPRAKTEEAIGWYKLAFERDDRPEVRDRAQVLAISLILAIQSQAPNPRRGATSGASPSKP